MCRIILLIGGVFLLNLNIGFGQIDTIFIKKNIFGTFYFQENHLLTGRDFHEIIKFNYDAEQEYKASKLNNVFATISAISSGLCLGWAVGVAQGGGKLNVGLLSLGIGLYGVTIPLSINQKKHKRNAAKIYNESLRQRRQNSENLNK